MTRLFCLVGYVVATVSLASCGGKSKASSTIVETPMASTDGPRKNAIAEHVAPFIDSAILDSVVVGISVNGKTEIYGFGRGTTGSPKTPPTADSLFEIGSITKIYTAMLVADAERKALLKLDDPLSDFLPPGITAPTRDGEVITLKQLLNHTSGLPSLPKSVVAESENPYANYNETMLYNDLNTSTLESEPGEVQAYSNFGAGLAGFVVGKKLGRGYAAELADRVLVPLGLRSTSLGVSPAQRSQVVTGANDDLKPTVAWTFDALAPAGGLMSSARDQVRMLEAQLASLRKQNTDSTDPRPLAMLAATHKVLFESKDSKTAYGWMIDGKGRYWHNGGTGGYHSFVGFDPDKNIAVVVLAATSSSLVDRLAISLFAIAAGDPVPPVKFPTAKELADGVGSYYIDELKVAIAVTQVNNRLYIAGPGEAPTRLIPLTAREFLIESLQTVVVFEEKAGTIGQLIFVIGGKQFAAKRLPDPTKP
jgi:serine-type D-Ala-D-Ala carboxypeptidase/endopeptidase